MACFPLPFARFRIGSLAVLALIFLPACEKRADGRWHFTGEPDAADKWVPPESVTDFSTLVRRNCTGCHGLDGAPGGALALDNPTWLRFITADEMRRIITRGRPGAHMPAFGQAFGGPLTNDQIASLVAGLMASRPSGSTPALPPYEGSGGDAGAGRALFARRCGGCHGASGTGGALAGSVVSPAYLGMVSDQYLRSVIVAGRPELKMPTLGTTLSERQLADLVAWLISHRRSGWDK